MVARELTDEQVFGAAPVAHATAAARELSDEEVFGDAARPRDLTREAIQHENEQKGVVRKVGEGMARGAAERVLGILQTARDVGETLYGTNPRDAAEKQLYEDVAATLNERGEGTGAAGFIGEIVGDPATAATLPIAAAGTLPKLIAQGAGIGAASGASAPMEDSNLPNRLESAAVGGTVGGAVPAAIGVTRSAVKAAPKLVQSVTGSLTQKGADERALDNVAKTLKKEGYAPERVEEMVRADQADELGATLAERTGSPGLLARQKNIAKGSGKAASDFSETIAGRNATQIPMALRGLAEPLRETGQKGVEQLGQVLQRSGARQVDVTDVVSDLMNRAAKTNPANAEGKIYQAVLDELGFAERQGNTFEALHRAKQALDNLYIEGADDALRARASRLTADVRKAINDKLKALDPDYGIANRKIQAGMVANDIDAALTSTNEGSVAALYNKLWAKPETRDELSSRLDPADFGRISRAMNVLKSIKRGGLAGSDTAENIATRAEIRGETGAPGLEAITDPGKAFGAANLGRRASDALRQKDLDAMQRVMTDPDGKTIAERMRGPAAKPPGPVIKATTGATVIGTGQDAKESKPAPRNPRPATGPRSSVQPELLDKIKQAESGGNPNAKNPNSSASGPYQFTDGTWASAVSKWGKEMGIGLKDKADPKAQARMVKRLADDNVRILNKNLGRMPTLGEVYMAHVFGAGGAEKLIRARSTLKDAVTLFPPKVVKANRELFFDGKTPRKAAALYAILEKKINGKG